MAHSPNVGGDQGGSPRVPGTDELKEDAGFGLVFGDVGEIIEDQEVQFVELIRSDRGRRDAGGVPSASCSALRQATKLSRRSDRQSEAGRFTSAATSRWTTWPGCSTARSGVGSTTTASTTSRLSTRPCDTSTVFWLDGRIGSSSPCDAIGDKQRTGSLALRGDNHRCSPTGRFCRGAAGQWEQDEARVSCPVVCPVKAGMFSREQTCRGRSQSPVVWIAEEMETEPSKPIDKTSSREVTSHRAVTTVNALWPRK